MESGRVGTPPDYLVNANERQYLAKLCWLLHDAGTHTMRLTFDGFHPPLSLRQHLGQQHVRSVLHRLWDQKILTEKQWRTLYPTKRKEIAALSSQAFDARVLSVLLQFVCHLSPPYPHGWSALPLPQDVSLSADVVRLQMYFQQAGSLGGVRHEEYPVLWKQIVEVLLRMGGPEVRVKIARIDQETLTPEQQTHYIGLVKNSWGTPDEGALGRLRKMGAGPGAGKGAGRGGSNRRRGQGDRSSSDQEGVSKEERAVVSKTHRQLCDSVMAEDIVDRLVQGHVIHFADRQEILTPGKNQDRMQILLSKIVGSKSSSAFKILMDSLKFKYPRVYESVNKVKKVVQREGVSEVMDVNSVCQEGLATHYRTLFSRVTPLPWSDGQTSIRDVYVPLDVASEDGKKLQLGQLLPAVVTSGHGKRVLVEGESGSGKTYLMAMLAYQWASLRTYFSNNYDFLIYLDARMIRGPLAKAVHSLVLPDNYPVGAEEFWRLLETHARTTIFLIDGFDEDHSNEELKQLILGDKLRHASVLLTSRPEARAGRWMSPDERLYVMGLSSVNVGRCLKSYAVISQMSSEEYDEFYDVVNSPEFEFRAHLGNPYVCLAVFGVYLTTGEEGLATITTLTSLFQQFLVAVATSFCRKLDIEVTGTQFSAQLMSGIGELQRLAYRTLVTKVKLLSEADLDTTLQHLRAAQDAGKEDDVTRSAAGSSSRGGEGEVNGHGEGEEEVGGGKGKQPVIPDASLLTKTGLLTRVGGGGGGGRWAFTCSTTREFLAARHLADLPSEALNEAVTEQKILRHPRFAQTASFLCGLFRQDETGESEDLASLVKDLSIQVLKHSRKITFKDDTSSTATTPDDAEEGGNGVGGCQVMTFSHCLQALSECSSHSPALAADLVKALPKTVVVARDGLIPTKCLHGLALAVSNPAFVLHHLEIDLLPYHVFQTGALHSLAEALSSHEHLQSIVIRWQSLGLMANFLKTCLAKAPPLHRVVLHDASKRTSSSKNVPASTWASLQEMGSLLRNTRSLTLENCGSSNVVSQWLLYLPITIKALDFSGCSFNSMSAAHLGSKLETSDTCTSLNLSDTFLETSDLSALFHCLKLNNSLTELSLAGSHVDRGAASALAEYIRLNNSVRKLNLSRCHVTTEACRILSAALSENHSLNTLDFTDADLSEEGKDIMLKAKGGEMVVLGFVEEFWS
ncbi:uncharacterized protein [Littorina saxatilis]|uniref:Uncharacterized protein n=1 Tax=Littorina saxatilis TaxID=31220 RepID=A0AAN9FVG2_9CAEN